MPPKVGAGVAGLVFNEENRLLLLKRKGSHGEGKWAPSGGWIEQGELAADAVVREILEETGLTVIVRFDTGFTEDIHPEGVHDICIWFWCEMDTAESPSIREPEKASDMGWFSYAEIADMSDELFLPLKIYLDKGTLLHLFNSEAEEL